MLCLFIPAGRSFRDAKCVRGGGTGGSSCALTGDGARVSARGRSPWQEARVKQRYTEGMTLLTQGRKVEAQDCFQRTLEDVAF